MHELAIAVSIVDIACEEVARHGAAGVSAVHLRVGALAGVVREALVFSFDAATAGTRLEGARLIIEDVPARAPCHTCGVERTLTDVARRRCPLCGAVLGDLVAGEELEIVAMELVDR